MLEHIWVSAQTFSVGKKEAVLGLCHREAQQHETDLVSVLTKKSELI